MTRRVLAAAAAIAVGTPAKAGLPTGGAVESGVATVTQSGSSLLIRQSTARIQMGWDSFSIAAGNSVAFQQPTSSSLAVNIVRGSDASVIAGNLSANGRVVLINPQGIAFAGTAQVNAGSLVASALRDASGDFSFGRTTLSGAGGEVANAGVITVSKGGSAVLAGSRVTNTGLIVADAGRVALAAGSQVALDYAGDGLLQLSVESGAVDALVANGGAIRVGSGHILLTAKSAESLAASVVRNSGELQASGIVERGGEVWLTADAVESSGSVQATSETGQGGQAHLVGRRSVSVTGSVDVTGGAKGGFVDVSAPAVLLPDLFQVRVGRGGHFLLDPDNIIIDAVGSPISGDPTSSDPATDITLSKFSIETWLSGGSDLTIDAIGDITVQSSITVVAPGAGGLTLDAGGSIDVQQPITTTGSLTLDAGADVDIDAALTSSSLAIIAGGDLSVGDDILTTAGDLDLQVGGDLFLDNLGGVLTIQSFADVNPVVAGDILTNIPLALGGTDFVVLTDAGANTLAQGWIVSDFASKVLTLAGDVRMQYGFGSGFALPTAEQLAFVPDNGTKYPDPYLNEDVDAGLQDGDTLADAFSYPNLSLSWTSGSPTANSAAGSTFGYSLALGAGFTVDSPGYVVLVGQNSGTLTVRARELLVKPDDLSGVYGSALKRAKYLYQITGYQNGHTNLSLGITGEAVANCDYDQAVAALRGAGDYPVRITQSTLVKSGALAANYEFNLQNGSYAIAKAPLTLAADNKSRDYGDPNPELTYAATGLISGYGDTLASALTGSLGISTVADASSNVGSYDIELTPGSASSANYELSLFDGVLTVNKASLQVKMRDANKVYGDALAPGYSYDMTGFKNGETEAALRLSGDLSGQVLYSSNATQASSVGTYTLTPVSVNLTAINYQFAPLNTGILTITPRSLAVDASPTREYGLENTPANITWNTVITGWAAVNGDSQALVSGMPLIIGVPAVNENAGLYTVGLAKGSLSAGPNYTFDAPTTYNGAATFTIAKATSLRFTAENKSRDFGDANPALTWTVAGFRNGEDSTVLSGSPALSTSATVLSGAGTYAISIAQGTLAAGNYALNLPANFVNGTLTVTKAPLQVVAVSGSRPYGEANPAFSAIISGFKNGENLATSGVTGNPSLTTTAVLTSNAGTYAITAANGTLAAANYSFAFTNGTLTVTKAPLTITASPGSRIYGTADDFVAQGQGYAITGYKNGETTAGLRATVALTGQPGFSSDTVLASPVASNAYVVTPNAGTLAATNYDFALSNYQGNVYDITKAVITVRASDKTRIYGDPNPALEYTLSGFKLGETTLGDVGASGLPTLSTTVGATSNVGAYPVTVSVAGMSASNYSFQAANGTITITKAPLNLAVDPATTEYGALFSGFTLTMTGFKNGETQAGLRSSLALSGNAAYTYSVDQVRLLDVSGSPYSVDVTGVGTLLATNYSFSLPAVPGQLTVTKAPITLTTKAIQKTYGDTWTQSQVDGQWDILGLRNGQSRDSLLVSGAVSGAPVISSPQALDPRTGAGVYGNGVTAVNGTFAVSATGNYSFSGLVPPQSASLTVNKATLLGAVDSTVRSYGYPNPAFTVTWTGYKNGDTAATSGFTGSLAFTTEANPASPVAGSPYAVSATVGTYASPNYSFGAIAPGLLTVERGNLWENELYNLAAAPLASAIRLEQIQSRLRGQPLTLDPQARIDFDKLSFRLIGVPSPGDSGREKDKEKPKAPAGSLSSN